MNQKSDEELYQQLNGQSELAFKILYVRHASRLFRFISRFTSGDFQSAEEVLQEVFTQLIEKKYSVESGATLQNWIYTVGKNKALSVLSKKKIASKNQTEVENILYNLDSESGEKTESLIFQLNRAVLELPAELKDTWALRKNGYDYQAIAIELNIPVGTVKSRFHRIVELLRQEISDELK